MPSRQTNPEVKGETTLPGEDSNLNSDVRPGLDRNFRSFLAPAFMIVLLIASLLEKLEFKRAIGN